MTDIIVRYVKGLGYLPMLVVDGKEVYRGEYQKTAQAAFGRASAMMEQL